MPEKPLTARPVSHACRVGVWSLPALMLLILGCGAPVGPTSCDGLADKTVAITRADYSKCAGEILGSLEELESSLRKYVDGDAAAKDSASSASRKLGHLMREVGFQGDAFREVKDGAGRTIERWPDASMRAFNAEIIPAAAQLNAALVFPNHDNLKEGARRHEQARNAWSQFR